MSINPYESPQPFAQYVGIKSGLRADVQTVATYQKGIMVCILLYFIALIAQTVSPTEEIRAIVLVALLINGIVGVVLVFLLSMKVYSVGVGILFAFLTLVPCVGLLMLLVINAKATAILRQNGLRVGLMGADTSQFK